MSIPKEPRQLMINLMYLVLTAMLALNVSAEIFSAFTMVDSSLRQSNEVLDDANDPIPGEIARLAQKDPDAYGHIPPKAKMAVEYGNSISEYIEKLKVDLIEEAGGYDEDGKMRGYKNKDVTTRVLVGLDPNKQEGKGFELEAMITEYRNKFLDLIEEDDKILFEKNISLSTTDDWKKSDKKSWAQYTFQQMPLGAVLPLLSKVENDAKSTENAVLNYFLKKVGGEDIVFNQFKVVSAPKKSYVIMGETFETDIFLSASSSSIEGMTVKVNGSNVPVKDGVANYSASASSTGIKPYNVEISITNPVTGEVTTEKGSFEYEVGQRSAAISLDKMNVFYIGVPNPITVSAAGISSNELVVNGTGGGIKISPKGGSSFEVNVTTQGEATLTLSGGGLTPTPFKYRVKRIPDPVPEVAGVSGGTMGNGTFKAQGGLIANLKDFDFDARCNITGYSLTRVARREDPVTEVNGGASFTGSSRRLVDQAKPGDTYFFNDIKAKCPGDDVNRALGSIVINIK